MTKNLSFKIISLLAAILLSQAVNSTGNQSVMSVTSEIELKSLPDNLVVVRPQKKEVKITLRGPSFLVGSVAASPPPFQIRVPTDSPGSFAAHFARGDIDLPGAVELVSVEPTEMVFELEPLESKEVRVEVPRIGQLPRNLTLDSVVVKPPVITVRGARSELRSIRSVEAQPLMLNDIDEPREISQELDLRVPSGQISLSERRVAVSVHVGEVGSQREFAPRPVEVRTAPDLGGASIEPSSVRVTLAGPARKLAALEPSSVVPFIRIQRVPDAKGSEIAVQVEAIPSITVVRIEPATVRAFRQARANSRARGSER
jgi:YbbR domain-containing protein